MGTWTSSNVFSSSRLRVAEKLEVELELQGVTGVEDKLQAGVGDTIEKLRAAGMKVSVFMLYTSLRVYVHQGPCSHISMNMYVCI